MTQYKSPRLNFLEKLKTKYFFVKDLRYLEIEKGWFDLVENLCEDILQLDPPESFEVVQIKQKFGGLRFYTSKICSGEIEQLISKAESDSYTICESCSKPGKKVCPNSYIYITCEECEKTL